MRYVNDFSALSSLTGCGFQGSLVPYIWGSIDSGKENRGCIFMRVLWCNQLINELAWKVAPTPGDLSLEFGISLRTARERLMWIGPGSPYGMTAACRRL